jgi:hypothetical protein
MDANNSTDPGDVWLDLSESEQDEEPSLQDSTPETTSRSSSFSSNSVRKMPDTPKTSSNESLPQIDTPAETSGCSSEGVNTTGNSDEDYLSATDQTGEASADGKIDLENRTPEETEEKAMPQPIEEEKEEERDTRVEISLLVLVKMLAGLVCNVTFAILEFLGDCKYFLRRCKVPNAAGNSSRLLYAELTIQSMVMCWGRWDVYL